MPLVGANCLSWFLDQAFVDFEKQVDSWRTCLEMMKLTYAQSFLMSYSNNPRIHLIIQNTFIYLLRHRWSVGVCSLIHRRPWMTTIRYSFRTRRLPSIPISLGLFPEISCNWPLKYTLLLLCNTLDNRVDFCDGEWAVFAKCSRLYCRWIAEYFKL